MAVATQSLQLERLVPANIDAEQAVLGAVLIDRDALVVIAAPPMALKAEHFFREGHGLIYQAMLDLFRDQQPRDIVTVTDRLERSGQIAAAGGVAYLHSLTTVVPTAVHVEHYARIVWRTSHKRRLITAGGQIAAIGYDETLEYESAAASAIGLLMQLGEETLVRGGGSVAEIIERSKEPQPEPIPCRNLPTLQSLLAGGWRAGRLYILTGAPSSGKTTLATDFALRALENQVGVLHITNEVDEQEMLDRYLCNLSGVNSRHVELRQLSDAEQASWDAAAEYLAPFPLVIHYGVKDPAEIALLMAVTKARHPDVERWILIVDYLQLLDIDPRDAVHSTDANLLTLQRIAIGEHVPVLLLSNLGKSEWEMDPYKWTGKETGNVKGYAHFFAGVQPDAEFNRQVVRTGKLRCRLFISKNRRGVQFFEVPYETDAATGRCYELDERHQDAPPSAREGHPRGYYITHDGEDQ